MSSHTSANSTPRTPLSGTTPPGYNLPITNGESFTPRNLFNDFKLEKKINEYNNLKRFYYFLKIYLSGNIKVRFPPACSFDYFIEKFTTNNYSYEYYEQLNRIVNEINRPTNGPVFDEIDKIIGNSILDEFTKELLIIIEDDFNNFVPITLASILPKLFSKFYIPLNNNNSYSIWGIQSRFESSISNNSIGNNPISNNLFSTP